jgi:Tfp pilus assembly protein PilN
MYAFFKSHSVRRLIATAAIAIVIAAFVARMVVEQRTAKWSDENERLASAVAPLKTSTQDVDVLHDLIRDFLARKQIIDSMASHSSPAAEVLAELSRLPRTIVLTHVRIDDLRLSAIGNSSGENEVNDMITRLGTSRFIGSPRIRKLDGPRHRDLGPNAWVFQVEMDLRP